MINSITRSTIQTKTQYRKMSAGNPRYSDMELIATTVVGSAGVASVTFTDNGAWSGYKHLQVRFTSRPISAGYAGTIYCYFNSDTASNYSSHKLYGNGSTVTSSANTSSGSIYAYAMNIESTSTANAFSANIIDILDFANTNKYKTAKWLTGYTGSGSNQVGLVSGSWRNTAAITTVHIDCDGDLVAGSRISLYGVRG